MSMEKESGGLVVTKEDGFEVTTIRRSLVTIRIVPAARYEGECPDDCVAVVLTEKGVNACSPVFLLRDDEVKICAAATLSSEQITLPTIF